MKNKVKTCTPISPEHKRANLWFSSLVHQIDISAPANESAKASLEHSIDFFRAFAQTGDKRFLDLCEDFLQSTIKATHSMATQAA